LVISVVIIISDRQCNVVKWRELNLQEHVSVRVIEPESTYQTRWVKVQLERVPRYRLPMWLQCHIPVGISVFFSYLTYLWHSFCGLLILW